MKRWLQALSPRAEFILVVGIAFGYFILSSLLVLVRPAGTAHMSQASFKGLIVHEILVFLLLWGFLHVRGWRLRELGLTPSWRDSLVGVGIAVLCYMVFFVAWLVFGHYLMGSYRHLTHLFKPDLSLPVLAAASIVNPIFEEVFVCGYIITALKQTRSLTFAINVSIAVRLAYHSYQGAFSLVGVLPVGIIYAYWYARTGRLWPLVIAHGLFDFLSMLAYIKH